jgi:hypothetical protein
VRIPLVVLMLLWAAMAVWVGYVVARDHGDPAQSIIKQEAGKG